MTHAILGGGITGLSAAYYLSKSSEYGIKLFESSHRLGGWIKTTKTNNGSIFEQGPRTLRCRGAAAENTLHLIKELGLDSLVRPILNSSKAAKNRMICLDNQLVKLPNSWTALFKINPPFIKPFIYAIMNDLVTAKKVVEDESIYDFVARRFGKQYAEIPVSAMVCGIFAGDAKEISVKALMRDIFEMEQKYGNVLAGFLHSVKNKVINGRIKSVGNQKKDLTESLASKKWSLWSFENGLETLPIELENFLRQQSNVEINLDSKCLNIEFKKGEVILNFDGRTESTEHLYSSLPSKDLAKILDNKFLYLKEELSSIPFVSVATVNLEYDGELIDNEGFGFLVPPNQNIPILGVIFDSCILPQNGRTILTVMLGGKWFDQHFGSNTENEKLLEVAQDHIKKILNIDKKPANFLVSVMTNCIPQYIVGHSERVKRIRTYVADQKLPLTLMGNSFDGIGVNDAIYSAKINVMSALSARGFERVAEHLR
ncbi:hypothetical protein RUM43_001156 [Polyplax serrata]|uniref:Protoporphyrinogen oxidase n=1 Tax=Polyplax serrata TaxID=468196 RepID=A0AAN8SDJ4_POLSC